MTQDPIDHLLEEYERKLDEHVEETAAAIAEDDRSRQKWLSAKARIRAVFQDVEMKLQEHEHSVGWTEGDDLMEIRYRARTAPPDRTGGTTFERKRGAIEVTNVAPDGTKVGGGFEEPESLTENRIREHVGASLSRALQP